MRRDVWAAMNEQRRPAVAVGMPVPSAHYAPTVGYRILADAAMIAHFGFLGFLIAGGFLAWRKPWVLAIHVPVAGWAVGIETLHWTCPLTELENWARLRAGQDGLAPTGFIDTYIAGTLYPVQAGRFVLTGAASIVLASWAGAFVRMRRRRRL